MRERSARLGVAQPPDGLALMVRASLVAPLPLLGLSLAFEGPHEIGHALGGVDVAGLAALAYIVGPSAVVIAGLLYGLARRPQSQSAYGSVAPARAS